MSTLESSYQGYKLARRAAIKANESKGQRNDVIMTGQGIDYGANYALVRDQLSEKKVVERFQYFVSKNKIGEVSVVLYNVFERHPSDWLGRKITTEKE